MKRLEGATRVERTRAIRLVEEALQDCGAYIEDFQLFSNIALALRFDELPLERLGELIARLGEEGIRIHELPGSAPAPAEGRTRGSLHLTFVHDEPDLKHEVPKVPG
ncbi:MAG: hypothetical protein P1V51_00085 [Deltaproteobacteria bacterium]|nr:hypothetical protein [Deltaproteobacteria bacterium]